MEWMMIRFFYVDENYANFLRGIEPHIPILNYPSHQKFVCGVLMDIGGIKYYAPVSSNRTSYRTSTLIYGKRRRHNNPQAIASIRFCYMFPVLDACIHRVDFRVVRATDPRYADLLGEEGKYCKQHVKEIQKKAKRIYRRQQYYPECNNFGLLEANYVSYNPNVIY